MRTLFVKTRVIDWVVVGGIVSIITACIALVSLGIQWYQASFDNYNIKSGSSFDVEYEKGTTQPTQRADIGPAKGSLAYSWEQRTGNSKCKYTFPWKKNSSSNYTVSKSNHSFSTNKKPTKEKVITSSNGKRAYNLKFTKTAGKSTKSKLRFHWMLI